VKVSDATLLTVHAGSIDQNSVLVDDINASRDLAREGTLLDDGNPTDLDKLLERHFRSTNNWKGTMLSNFKFRVLFSKDDFFRVGRIRGQQS
jgi:hypothetical protein